jgi:hypothetical protein
MIRFYFIIIILTVILSYSCNKKGSNIETKKLEIKTSNSVKNLSLSKIAKNTHLVKLHTDSVFLIGAIRKIVLKENIYVQNFKKLLVYDSDGIPIFAINNTGKAGDEYYEINDFYVDTINNVIEIWDRVKRTLFLYDNYTGILIKKIKINIDANFFRKLDNDYIFYSNGSYSSKNKEVARVFHVNSNYEIKEEFLRSDYVKMYHFNTPEFLSEINSEIYVEEAPLSKIWHITKQGCNLSYEINIDNQTMTKEEYISMRNLRSSDRFRKLWNEYTLSLGETNVNQLCIKLSIRANGNGYYCFYNPRNDHYHLTENIFEDTYLNIPIWYSNICNNKIICQIPTYKVIESGVDYEPLAKTNPDLYNMIKDLNKFDNPILIISDLKAF